MNADHRVSPQPCLSSTSLDMVVNVLRLDEARATKSRQLLISMAGLFFLSIAPTRQQQQQSVGAEGAKSHATAALLGGVLKRFIPLCGVDALTTYACGTVLHVEVKREHDVVLLRDMSSTTATASSSDDRGGASILEVANRIVELRTAFSPFPLVLRSIDTMPLPSWPQLSKQYIAELFPLSEGYTNVRLRLALRRYASMCSDAVAVDCTSEEHDGNRCNCLLAWAEAWKDASEAMTVDVEEEVTLSDWNAASLLRPCRVVLGKVLPLSLPTWLVSLVLKQHVVLGTEVRVVSTTTRIVRQWPPVSHAEATRHPRQQKPKEEKEEEWAVGDTSKKKAVAEIEWLLLTCDGLILSNSRRDGTQLHHEQDGLLVKSLYSLAKIQVDQSSCSNDGIATTSCLDNVGPMKGSRIILFFEERAEMHSNMTYQLPPAVAHRVEGSAFTVGDDKKAAIMQTECVLCIPSVSASLFAGSAAPQCCDARTIANAIAVLLGRDGISIPVVMESTPRAESFSLSLDTFASLEDGADEDIIIDFDDDIELGDDFEIEYDIDDIGIGEDLAAGDVFVDDDIAAAAASAAGDAASLSRTSPPPQQQQQQEPPDYRRPVGPIPRQFTSDVTLLARQVLRLTSKRVWELRVLVVTHNTLFICDKRTSVRRRIPLAAIVLIRLLLHHREGSAVVCHVRCEHDLVVKEHPATPSWLALGDFAHLIVRECPSICFKETNLADAKDKLKVLLKHLDLRRVSRCASIPQRVERFHESRHSTATKVRVDTQQRSEASKGGGISVVPVKKDGNSHQGDVPVEASVVSGTVRPAWNAGTQLPFTSRLETPAHEVTKIDRFLLNEATARELLLKLEHSRRRRILQCFLRGADAPQEQEEEASLTLSEAKVAQVPRALDYDDTSLCCVASNPVELENAAAASAKSVSMTNGRLQSCRSPPEVALHTAAAESDAVLEEGRRSVCPRCGKGRPQLLVPYTRADDVAQWAREVLNPLSSLDTTSSWTVVRFQCSNDVMVCVGNTAFVRHVRHAMPSILDGAMLTGGHIVTCYFYPFGLGTTLRTNNARCPPPCWGGTLQVQQLLREVSSVPLSTLLLPLSCVDANAPSAVFPATATASRLLHNAVYCRVGSHRWFEIPLSLFVADCL
ncbi:hypothetical protein DQ04_01651030 [Trypanosoma grayi]|uniref:hypothetical protein n=1 Tax=Trypanosoma grayi TaxID=71804 RepID=UPI0004F4AECF|nr:hypothetical protein DQ04_01651030 [Trypanosoma grayi]KEG12512.1 hypothetical protein DQ04_01651030 [Trypanosoma grayi]